MNTREMHTGSFRIRKETIVPDSVFRITLMNHGDMQPAQ